MEKIKFASNTITTPNEQFTSFSNHKSKPNENPWIKFNLKLKWKSYFFSNHKSKPNEHHTWSKSNLHQIQSQLQMSSLLLSAITNLNQMSIILGSNPTTTPYDNHTFSAITNPSQMSIILGAHRRKVSTETSEVNFYVSKVSFALLCFVKCCCVC